MSNDRPSVPQAGGLVLPLAVTSPPVDSLYPVPVTVGKSTVTVNLSLSTNTADLYAFSTACDNAVCHAYNGPLYAKSASFIPRNSSEIGLAVDFEHVFDPSLGQVGRDTVSIGGVTTKNQTIGAVDNATSDANWNGTAGILELGFPMTFNFVQGAALVEILNFAADKITTYDVLKQLANLGALLPRLFLNRVIDQSMFSISLQGKRNEIITGTGQLTIGRLPDGVDNSSVTRVPVRLYDTENGGINPPVFGPNDIYPLNWEVEIGGVFLDGQQLADSKQSPEPGIKKPTLSAVVDTNAVAVGGPQDVVKTIRNRVSPAFASDSNAAPTLPCGAPHNLTFQIGGKPFAIDASDFVAQSTASACVANVIDIPAPGNQSLSSWSLGQPFLRSSLVVFYYGNFSHPSFDPSRMGFMSLVGPGAARLNAALSGLLAVLVVMLAL